MGMVAIAQAVMVVTQQEHHSSRTCMSSSAPLEGLHVHLDALSPVGAEAECMVVDGCPPDEAAQTDAPVREACETQPHPAEVLVLCPPTPQLACGCHSVPAGRSGS